MVVLLNSDESMLEDSIFAVWETVGVSPLLTWSGNRSNLLFRE